MWRYAAALPSLWSRAADAVDAFVEGRGRVAVSVVQGCRSFLVVTGVLLVAGRAICRYERGEGESSEMETGEEKGVVVAGLGFCVGRRRRLRGPGAATETWNRGRRETAQAAAAP